MGRDASNIDPPPRFFESSVSSRFSPSLPSLLPFLFLGPETVGREGLFHGFLAFDGESTLIPQALGLYRGADLATENSGNVLIVK